MAGHDWKKWGVAAVALAAAAISCFMLQRWQEYSFFYREQTQIFLFDWSDVLAKSREVGGLALVISQFLVQFFRLHLAGALLTAITGVADAFLLWRGAARAGAPEEAFPLCLLPFFLQEGALGDSLYRYQGFMAFFLMAFFLWVYARAFSRKGTALRTVAGTGLSVLLYWAAGPVALLFAGGIVIVDLLSLSKGWPLSALSLLAVLVCAILSIRLGVTPGLRTALLQDFYYESHVLPGPYIHASWICLPLVLLMAVLAGKLKGTVLKGVAALAGAVLSLAVLPDMSHHIDKKYYDLLRLAHFTEVGDWDTILSDRTARRENLLMMSVRNLALSRKGQLLDRLFEYPQSGPMSLLVSDDLGDRTPDIAVLGSNIGYAMGNCAYAQNKAFDASVGIRYGNPAMMMRLIRTNLVMGAWEVAGKYITMMEKTWAYRDEASELRCFLGDMDAVSADPELGRMRRCLPVADHFVGMDPHKDLELILEASPEDAVSREYYVAFMLLAKDMEGLKSYIENDPLAYGSDGSLHVHLQEAVLVYAEGDEEYCRAHGVTDDAFARYDAFKKKFFSLGASRSDPVKGMRSFSDSFWYYYMFVKS